MNAELKTKWIAALRSGKYRQTFGILRELSSESPGFCCLGVLCEVEGRSYSDRFGGYEFEPDEEGNPIVHDAEPTTAYAAQHGIAHVVNHLMAMNDGEPGKGIAPEPFSAIADWIDANIPADGGAS